MTEPAARHAARRPDLPAAEFCMDRAGTMTRLAGAGLLADDLYLLAHDDKTGRPCVQARALGLGLGGALLGELMLDGMIAVRSGALVVTAPIVPSDQQAR